MAAPQAPQQAPPPGNNPGAARATAQAASAAQAAANARFLNQYGYANGNMSVPQRLRVLVPPLMKLGYTKQEATQIVVDAPLNSVYTNEKAYEVALQYAASIAPGSTQTSMGAALAAKPIPMPKPAQKALQSIQQNNKPLGKQRGQLAKSSSRLAKGWRSLSDRLRPTFDKVGDSSTPGGIGSLFAVNLLFLAAVVPANSQGYTRLELLWLTLMNRTYLLNEIEPPEPPDSAIVAAVIGAAEGVQATAKSIGDVANAVGNVASIPGQFFQNIPVIGGIIGAFGGGGPEDTLPPVVNPGSKPPSIRTRAPEPPRGM